MCTTGSLGELPSLATATPPVAASSAAAAAPSKMDTSLSNSSPSGRPASTSSTPFLGSNSPTFTSSAPSLASFTPSSSCVCSTSASFLETATAASPLPSSAPANGGSSSTVSRDTIVDRGMSSPDATASELESAGSRCAIRLPFSVLIRWSAGSSHPLRLSSASSQQRFTSAMVAASHLACRAASIASRRVLRTCSRSFSGLLSIIWASQYRASLGVMSSSNDARGGPEVHSSSIGPLSLGSKRGFAGPLPLLPQPACCCGWCRLAIVLILGFFLAGFACGGCWQSCTSATCSFKASPAPSSTSDGF
mmetsp:Transcript_6181/g.17267  ORF Transcript_6181/g.17267 Transcript_6181/m.17267 type:complete len:307 (+) Transcript_6181:873-1793(+)